MGGANDDVAEHLRFFVKFRFEWGLFRGRYLAGTNVHQMTNSVIALQSFYPLDLTYLAGTVSLLDDSSGKELMHHMLPSLSCTTSNVKRSRDPAKEPPLTFDEISAKGNSLHPLSKVDLISACNGGKSDSSVSFASWEWLYLIGAQVLDAFVCVFQDLLTPFTSGWRIYFSALFIVSPNSIRAMTQCPTILSILKGLTPVFGSHSTTLGIGWCQLDRHS